MDRPLPVAERIAADIRRQITQGQLAPGTGLPSLRDHAQACAVAKNTVVKAYELLVADGFVEPRRGSGYYVTGNRAILRSAEGWAPALDLALSAAGIHRDATDATFNAPSLGEGLPPSAWLEDCRLDRYMQKIGRSGLGTVFRYGDPAGYMPLRKNIALRLQGFGMAVEPTQVVLTQGAYQAVDLVIRRLVRPGDAVLVDDPGFYPTFHKLRLQGARVLGVPRTPDGPDFEVLSDLLRRHRPRVFFTQSCAHNPTGSDMSSQSVATLMDLAQRHGLTVVDDDALADFAGTAPRIGSADQLGQSIYVGSFSKALSSVVRVGFLACSADMARELTRIKTIVSLNSSQYAERTVDAVITEGRFLKHSLALRARTRAAMRTTQSLFDAQGVEPFCRPRQSLFLWARLPGVDDSLAFARRMYARGIAMAPGAVFSPDANRRLPWFRFNVGFVCHHPRLDEVFAEARQWPRAGG